MNNLILLIVPAAVLFVTVSAYDFSDSIYNQYLAEELEDLHEYFDELQTNPALYIRNRRDEEAVIADKCRRKKPLCCAESSFDQLHEKLRDFKRECFKQVTGHDKEDREFDPFKCEKVEKHKKEITCTIQCVGQKMNVLDDAGNLKDKEVENFVKEMMVNETWFGEMQDKVVATCLDESKKASENQNTNDSGACNPSGVKLAHCLFREIQMGCPTEQIKDQKACNRARDKIKRHNDFFSSSSLNDE